jgi:hypothetical protein
MATTKIWKDTIRWDFCRGATCRRRIVWAQIVASGRQMCFDRMPEAIVTEEEILTKREMLTVDLAPNHWATCPDRARFKRPRHGVPRSTGPRHGVPPYTGRRR